jgi:RNA polymerase sigma-70 factor (ECF subfamily)
MPRALRDLPDEDLMLAYAGGDAAAFDVLYARHEAALYRFVRRLLGARLAAQADEVFQDAWLRIVAARASFVPQGAA